MDNDGRGDYIKTGDLIFLFSQEHEEDGYISSNQADYLLAVKREKDSKCVFKILPRVDYDHDDASSDVQLLGKDLIYGQIVEFQSQVTEKYVVSSEGDMRDEGEYQASLSKTGSKDGHFKILPVMNGINEGEKVCSGDKVKIENVLTGCLLHQSTLLNEEDLYNVDLLSSNAGDSSYTPWILQHSDIDGGYRKILKNNDLIRFYHEEAGFVSGTVEHGIFGRLLTKEIKYAFQSIWKIQLLQPELDMEWNNLFRLQLFGTNKYMCTHEEAHERASGEVTLLKIEELDDDLDKFLFCFVPITRTGDEIPYGIPFLIQSAKKIWLHCSGTNRGDEHLINGAKKFNFKDTFTIQSVPTSFLEDYDYVKENRSILVSFLENPSLKKKARSALSDYIKWMIGNESDLDTKMKNVVFNYGHQKFLDSEILLFMDIAFYAIEQREVRLGEIIIKLLGYLVTNNEDCAQIVSDLFVFPELDQDDPKLIKFLTRVPLPFLLNQMYKSSTELVYNVTSDMIRKIFDLVNFTKSGDYVGVIRTLCRQKKMVFYENQKRICQILTDEYEHLINETKVEKDTTYLKYNGKWLVVAELTSTDTYPESEIFLVENTYNLLSDLCYGRNKECIEKVLKYVGSTHSLASLKDMGQRPLMRAAFCDILLRAHFENDGSNYHPNLTKFKRAWDVSVEKRRRDDVDGEEELFFDPKEYFFMVSQHDYLVEEGMNVMTYTAFALKYVSVESKNFRFDESDLYYNQPKLLYKIIKLLRKAFYYGYCKRKEEILMRRFFDILEEMRPDSYKQSNGKEVPRELDEYNKDLMVKIRIELIQIMNRFYDIELSTQYKDFLSDSQIKKKRTDSSTEVLDKLSNYFISREGGDFNPTQSILIPTEIYYVISQLQYEDSDLTDRALKLASRMLRHSCVDSNTTYETGDVMFVLNKYKDIFEESLLHIRQLRNTLKITKKSDWKEIKSILKFFTIKCCDPENAKDYQTLFRKLLVHEEVLNIVRRSYASVPRMEEQMEEITNDIMSRCFQFLAAFASDNSENQLLLHKKMDIMLQRMPRCSYPESIASCIVEIHKNNIEICADVSPRILEIFIEILFEYGRDPIFLEFFRHIMKPAGTILKQNQNLVLDLLSSYEIDFILGKDDYTEDDNNVAYRTELVYLLALTAEGKNYYTEIACQQLISLEECIDLCAFYRKISDEITASYAFFIDEVFLNTESSLQIHPVLLLQFNFKFWKIMKNFLRVLRIFNESNQLDVEHIKLHEFTFKTITPFIIHFYEKGFISEKVTDVNRKISNMILDEYFELRQNIKRNDNDKFEVTQCMKTMFDAGVTGSEEHEDDIAKIMNSVLSRKNYIPLKKFDIDNFDQKQQVSPGKLWFDQKINQISRVTYSRLIEFMEEDEEVHLIPYFEILLNELGKTNPYYSLKKEILLILREYLSQGLNDEVIKRRQEKIVSLTYGIKNINWQLTSEKKEIRELAIEVFSLLLDNRNLDKNNRVNDEVSENFLEVISADSSNYFLDVLVYFNELKDHIKNFMQLYREAKAKHNEVDLVLDIPNMYHNILLINEMCCQGKSGSFYKALLVKPKWDIVKEVVTILKLYLPHLSEHNVTFGTQLFNTLREFVYQSEENQLSAIAAQVLGPANSILSSDYLDPQLGIDEVYFTQITNLKISVVIFLQTLVSDAPEMVIKEFSEYIVPQAVLKNTVLEELFNEPETISLASSSFRLLKFMADSNPESKTIQDTLEKCEENCKNKIVHIEVVTGNKLQSIYFPIPEDYRNQYQKALCFPQRMNLEEATQKSESDLSGHFEDFVLNEDVNWNKPSEKAKVLVKWCSNRLVHTEYLNVFKDKPFVSAIAGMWDWLWNISFIITVLLNLLLIFTVNVPPPSLITTINPEDEDFLWSQTIFVLGVAQSVTAFLIFMIFIFDHGFLHDRLKWYKRIDPENTGTSLLMNWKTAKRNLPLSKNPTARAFSYRFGSVYNILSNGFMIYYMIYFVVSIFGNCFTPIFFAFHLSQILIRFESSREILKSLWQNKGRLLLMLFLIFCITYFFSIFTYNFYQVQYNDSGNGLVCNTLVQCMMSTVYWGVPSGGGLFEFVDAFPRDPWNGDMTAGGIIWIIAIVVFHTLVGVILTNVVLAIIVDSFSQIRNNKTEAKEETNSSCFICSIDRETFRKNHVDFNQHVESEHSVLHYLYFFTYLKSKKNNSSDNSLTKIQSDIIKVIDEGNFHKFLPIGKALSITVDNEGVDTLYKVLDKSEKLRTLLQLSDDNHDRTMRQMNDISKSLTKVVNTISEMKTSMSVIQGGVEIL